VDDDECRRRLAVVPLLGARWRALRGMDPTALLRTADARIDEIARRDPAAANDLRADSALDAALWAHRSGRAAPDACRRGLEAIAGLIAEEPRDAQTWAEKAHLEALAGDSAQAQVSLEHAFALNPLVRGSWPSRQVQALLGGSATALHHE
jgi:hypothetical protein